VRKYIIASFRSIQLTTPFHSTRSQGKLVFIHYLFLLFEIFNSQRIRLDPLLFVKKTPVRNRPSDYGVAALDLGPAGGQRPHGATDGRNGQAEILDEVSAEEPRLPRVTWHEIFGPDADGNRPRRCPPLKSEAQPADQSQHRPFSVPYRCTNRPSNRSFAVGRQTGDESIGRAMIDIPGRPPGAEPRSK
jgi:hypothetical protein